MTLAWGLPITSGIADAGMRVVIKTSGIPIFALNGMGFLCALPIYAVWLFFTGIPDIKTPFWYAIAGHVPLMIIAFTLMVMAHRASPLALTAPYLALTAAYTLITSPLMGTGEPNSFGAIGILVLTLGIYVINTREKQKSLLDPFRQLGKERGPQLMFIVGLIFAVTANFDLIAFQNANAPFYLLVDHGLVGLSCISIALFLSVAKIHGGAYVFGAKHIGVAMLFGLALGMSVVPHMLAFEWIPNVPYVIAGKRAGVILFSVAMGIILALMTRFGDKHKAEREHLRYRIPGALIMTVGMVIIILYGLDRTP